MKVKYVGRHRLVDVHGVKVGFGEELDVDDVVGRSLLTQKGQWEPVKGSVKAVASKVTNPADEAINPADEAINQED